MKQLRGNPVINYITGTRLDYTVHLGSVADQMRGGLHDHAAGVQRGAEAKARAETTAHSSPHRETCATGLSESMASNTVGIKWYFRDWQYGYRFAQGL